MKLKSLILAAPLLPSSADHTDDVIFDALKKCRFPVMASLKKDGIRAVKCSTLLSRTFKQIPNIQLRVRSMILPSGFDMELWNKELQYHEIESIVMSKQHPDTDKIEFHILDWIGLGSYAERVYKIMQMMPQFPSKLGVKFSPPVLCNNAEQLMAFFKLCEEEAGEGMCFRTPVSPYKQGRSTLNEQYLVKLSRYVTGEAVIVGFEEQMENTNKMKWNGIGKMDRSSAQEGMVGKNTLGCLIVEKEIELSTVKRGEEAAVCDAGRFRIGTGQGLTDKLRKEIWENQDKYLGRTISYRSKPHGEKLKPRSPTFRGFRDGE